MSAAEPSMFWQRLGREHQRQLGQFGVETFKRHQALRYFTWSWKWSAIRRSEQIRFLLRHTSPWLWIRAAAPGDLSDEAWEGVSWQRRDRWLYSFATRLLWDFAERHDPLGVCRLSEPRLGNPFPVTWGDRLISQDLANTALELGAVAPFLDAGGPRHVLEIGAGYGRSAYAVLSTWPTCRYTIVDIEPAISLGRAYLTELFGTERLSFMTPDRASPERIGPVDLALSISSLQEMTPEQVAHYLWLMDAVVSGVVFLKQWARWRNPDDGVVMSFEEYPIPSRWRLLFKASAPVQTSFTQAGWEVGVSRS